MAEKKTRRKLSGEDKAWWSKIFFYIEKEILGYDDNQHIQKTAVLRVKGLENGKVIANNNLQDNGKYPLEVVYGAIVVSKSKYHNAIKGKNFRAEADRVAYFCAIARNQLNAVYNAWKEKEHSRQIANAIQAEEKHDGAAYKPKPRRAVANVSGSFW